MGVYQWNLCIIANTSARMTRLSHFHCIYTSEKTLVTVRRIHSTRRTATRLEATARDLLPLITLHGFRTRQGNSKALTLRATRRMLHEEQSAIMIPFPRIVDDKGTTWKLSIPFTLVFTSKKTCLNCRNKLLFVCHVCCLQLLSIIYIIVFNFKWPLSQSCRCL